MAQSDASTASKHIRENAAIHDKLVKKYERLHGEIFNPIEQQRLLNMLQVARDSVCGDVPHPKALDFGCGSGNLSRHLLDIGCNVTGADVSPGFLHLVEQRFPDERFSTLLMNGEDLREVADDSFDLVATYSVLHHIPDYLAAVKEMARVCKPGGVVMIDHEQNEAFWLGDPVYKEFRKAALRPDWGKYLRPSNYVHKLRRLFNPRHTNEGDIHVFADDHIEWSHIRAVFEQAGFEILVEEDYLLSRRLYRAEVYERYVDRCTDTKVMLARKK